MEINSLNSGKQYLGVADYLAVLNTRDGMVISIIATIGLAASVYSLKQMWSERRLPLKQAWPEGVFPLSNRQLMELHQKRGIVALAAFLVGSVALAILSHFVIIPTYAAVLLMFSAPAVCAGISEAVFPKKTHQTFSAFLADKKHFLLGN